MLLHLAAEGIVPLGDLIVEVTHRHQLAELHRVPLVDEKLKQDAQGGALPLEQ